MEKGYNCEICEIRKEYLRLKALIDGGHLVPTKSFLQDIRLEHNLVFPSKDGEDLCYNGTQFRHSEK